MPGWEYRRRDGGLVGDEVVRRLVTGVGAVLAPGGSAQLLGNWEHRAGEGWHDRVTGWLEESGLDGWVVQREVQDPADYAETWIRDGGQRPGPVADALLEAWLDDFAARGVEAVGLGFVVLHAPPADAAGSSTRPRWRRVEEVTGRLDGPLGGHVAAVLAARDRLAAARDEDLLAAHLRVADDVTEERHARPGEGGPRAVLLRAGGGLGRTASVGPPWPAWSAPATASWRSARWWRRWPRCWRWTPPSCAPSCCRRCGGWWRTASWSGPRDPRGPLAPGGRVLVALACAAGVVVLHRVFVATAHGQAVDEAALSGARARLWRLQDSADLVLDSVSALAVLAALAAVAVAALVQRRVRLALAAVALVVGALATTQVVKRLLLARPDLDVTYALDNSLPSGHTTFAAAVSAAALLVSPVRLRPLVAVVGAAYTAVIGVGTLAAGWHRPSDVVAAALVVLAWGALLAPLAGGRASGGAGSPGRAVAGTVLVVGAAVGLVGGAAALVAVWAAVPPRADRSHGAARRRRRRLPRRRGAACVGLLVLLLLQRAADRAAAATTSAAERAADRATREPPGPAVGARRPSGGGAAGPAGGTVLGEQPAAAPAARPPGPEGRSSG